jgi:hypothetical protein
MDPVGKGQVTPVPEPNAMMAYRSHESEALCILDLITSWR